MKQLQNIFLILWFLFLPFLGIAQFYSGSQVEFGKNRIQYHPFDWSFFRYERFDVFFYAGGRELALNVAAAALQYLPALEQRFDYSLENRVQILIFNRLSDLKQTNLGTGAESALSLGGTGRQSGNKLFLYSDDGQADLYAQLREALSQLMVSELLFGTDLKDKIRSSGFLYVPEWYLKGLTSWISEPWDSRAEGILKDGFYSGRFSFPEHLKGEDAVVFGRSVWRFVAEVYGERIIPDILDMTHVSRNVDGGFRYVLGLKFRELMLEWGQFYRNHFGSPPEQVIPPTNPIYSRRAKSGIQIGEIKWSRDGKYLAWTENRQGRVSIFLYETGSKKLRKIASMGRRLPDITDHSFPLLAWHPGNELLVYSDEHKGRLRLNFHHIQSGETERKFLEFFTKVHGMDISPDGRRILMSATRQGKPDLYVFHNASNTIEAWSDDGFDESGARWMPDGNSVLFSSNRNTDSLKTGRIPEFAHLKKVHDLYLIRPLLNKNTCIQLSNTPGIHEEMPVPIDNRHWTFLSDENGIVNRYLGVVDSAITQIDTTVHYRYFMRKTALSNEEYPVLNCAAIASGLYAQTQYIKGKYVLSVHADALKPFPEVERRLSKWGQTIQQPIQAEPEPPKDSVITSGRVRQIVVFGKEKTSDVSSGRKPDHVQQKPDKIRQRVYFTSWYKEQFSTRIDRAFLNQSYQPLTENTGYINPSINGLIRFGLSDLMEDYRITAGIRLSGNFSGNEYLLAFQDQKKRLDKTYTFHRQSIQSSISDGIRLYVHTLSSRFSWPFSPVSRINGNLAYRNDRRVYLSADLSGLRAPNEISHWVQPNLEYVFDNTFPLNGNMMSGTRMKISTEFFIKPGKEFLSVGVIGFDLRHYVELGRETIFALRFAGGGSFGRGRLLFRMGGVDNWLMPATESGTAINGKQHYVFQTLATNLRGFRQNIRNGTQFGVVNAELRWNPIRFFSKYPVRSDFFNALQLIGFFDVGTAYTGPHPWSEKNLFNQTTIQNGPIKVILKNLNNPMVMGSGLGVRARIFGYFVRFDYARGFLNGKIQPRIMYLSFCSDF